MIRGALEDDDVAEICVNPQDREIRVDRRSRGRTSFRCTRDAARAEMFLNAAGGDMNRLAHRKLALTGEPVPQRLAADERHVIVQQIPGDAGVVQWQDVRMLKARGDSNLAQKSVGANNGGELGAQHLDRDVPFVLEIRRAEDDRHPTLAELARECVALAEARLQSLEKTGHDTLNTI